MKEEILEVLDTFLQPPAKPKITCSKDFFDYEARKEEFESRKSEIYKRLQDIFKVDDRKIEMTNKAFSYIRFSSEQQATGHSLQRQLEGASRYAAEHGLDLDTSSYRDLGVSAFKSKNKDEGALGAFLQAVEDGRIPIGSVLIIESFDRLSRDKVDVALQLLLRITGAGITIVTLQDNQTYSRESIRDNWTKLIVALAVLARANEESETKSKRVKAAWEKKRTTGGILTGVCPAWLVRDGEKWQVKPDKAQTVQRIFDLAHQGYGSPKIAATLNQEKVPTMQWATNWSFGAVHAILKNKAVIGTLVPKKALAEEIENYYPAIIEPAFYWEVQKRIESRRWTGGRNTDNVRNLFSGMTYCTCGSKMRSVGSNGKHTYLRCLSSFSKSGCDQPRFPYLPIERCLMARWELQGRLLWGEEEADRRSKVNPRVALEAQRDELRKKIDNLVAAIEEGHSKTLAGRITGLEEQLEQVEKTLAEPEPERLSEVVLEAGKLFERYQQVLTNNNPAEVLQWRMKAQASIRRFLQKVEVGAATKRVILTYRSGKVRLMDVEPFFELQGFQPGNVNGQRSAD